MEDEDYYNNKAFDELVDIKDNISNQDPDSFNKEIDRIYQDHKGKLTCEENNVNRPVSKIMVRRITSADVICNEEDIASLYSSISKKLKENNISREQLMFSENLLLKLEQFKHLLLVDLKCQLNQNEMSKLYSYLSSNSEGVVYTTIFFDKLSFQTIQDKLEHSNQSLSKLQPSHVNEKVSIRHEEINENAVNPSLQLNPNTISQQMLSKKNSHFNEKVSMQFKMLNREIKELISNQPIQIHPLLQSTKSLKKDSKKKVLIGKCNDKIEALQSTKLEFRTTTLPNFNSGRPQTSLAARNTTSMTKYLNTELWQAKPIKEKKCNMKNVLKESKTKVSK